MTELSEFEHGQIVGAHVVGVYIIIVDKVFAVLGTTIFAYNRGKRLLLNFNADKSVC